jgi:hypothetical protein
MTNMIKLANGKEVTLDEFLSWGAIKQHHATLNNNARTYAYRYYTPAGVFEKLAEAIEANGCSRNAFIKRIKNKNFVDWYREPININYINKLKKAMKHSKKWQQRFTGSKPVMTPNGKFPSVQSVADAAKVDGNTIRRWMKKWPEHYYYVV